MTATVTPLSWKQQCRAGNHRWRGKEHQGCELDPTPHWHVSCRRCPEWWLELMLFDPTPFDDRRSDAAG